MANTLYVTDLDGTLLNSESEISTYTLTTINRLIDAGALITVATGRCSLSSERALQQLDLKLPWVTYNGSVIHCPDAKHPLVTRTLNNDLVVDIVEHCKTQNFSLQFVTLDSSLSPRFYYEEIHNASVARILDYFSASAYRSIHILDKVDQILNEQVLAIETRGSYDQLQSLKNQLEQNYNIQTYFYPCYFTSSYHVLEIHHHLATKGHGIAHIRSNLSVEKVVGFGDEFNDVPMFHTVDHACAVSNATDELKELADIILESNDHHAVAKYIHNDFFD